MDSNLLKVFVVVSEKKSISLAAQVLGFTQSNVTLRIKQLEKNLGYALFYRVPKGVILTPEGETLYPMAIEIVQKVEHAIVQMKNRNQQSLLRIGSSQANAIIRLLPFMEKLQEDFPSLLLELYTGGTPDVLAQLLSYKIDIGFVSGDPLHKDIVVLNRFKDDLYVVEPKRRISPNTLLGYREKSTHFEWFQRYEQSLGNVSYKTMILENYEVMLGCVRAGMGSAFLSKHIIDKIGYTNELNLIKLPEDTYELQTCLVCRKDHLPFDVNYFKSH